VKVLCTSKTLITIYKASQPRKTINDSVTMLRTSNLVFIFQEYIMNMNPKERGTLAAHRNGG
jgi:hypothetical protein